MVDITAQTTHPPATTGATKAGGNAESTPVWLISDDPMLRQKVATVLQSIGIEVDVIGLTGDRHTPLLPGRQRGALVDLSTQPMRALTTIERIRMGAATMPILALVPSGQAQLPVDALRAGADDFCDRHATLWELSARVLSLTLRRQSMAEDLVVVGDLSLDLRTRCARRAGVRLSLSARQFELLHLLMRHAGEALSHIRIAQELQLPSRERGSNVVEVHVHHLRRHIGPGRLSTLRGRGYLLHAVAAPDGN